MTADAGPLQPLLDLPGVTDVLVNGPRDVWLDRGRGCERVDAALGTADDVRALAVRLASLAGRRLDDAQPCVDGRLPTGVRLHAALPPVADRCAAISLRVVREQPFTLADLAAAGALTPAMATALGDAVRAHVPILISGATGAGKTTLAAALLSLVDPRERIVIIEETGELAPAHPHVVRLVERRANVEGAGAVTVAALVREALRMRPDRLVVGECRGAELREVLMAANTGHRGTLTTVHANAAADVPARLLALGALAGLSDAAVRRHARAAFRVIVHLERGRDGVRRVEEVGVLSTSARAVTVRPALTWSGRGEAEGELVALASGG